MDTLSEVQHCAESVFGIHSLKPFQLLVVCRIVEQSRLEKDEGYVKNQLIILPTGGGKSLCFLVPAVVCSSITLIVYPLLALMNDQLEKLKSSAIDCVVLKGGQNSSERNGIYAKLHSGTKIVITNPETLCQKSVLSSLREFEIELFVIDEAHVISQWGKEFRPAYLKLKDCIEVLNPHQIIAFTATASDQTVDDISSVVFSEKPLVLRADADRDNIFYSAYPVYSKKQGLYDLISHSEKPAIVFCKRRHDTYTLCVCMKRFFPDIPMLYYHAGLSHQERELIEKNFKHTENGVLFATCAYGMGVDIPGIRTVIHYDVPDNSLEYLQESGRAGRDRKAAKAWVLVQKNTSGRQIGKCTENVGESNAVLRIFEDNTVCRRKALLKSLGEFKEECSGCDVCTHRVMEKPGCSDIVRKAVRRFPFRFSFDSLCRFLCGIDKRYKYNSDFGLLSDINYDFLIESVKNMNFGVVYLHSGKALLYDKNNKISVLFARFIGKKKVEK